jgi:hypothetical protein
VRVEHHLDHHVYLKTTFTRSPCAFIIVRDSILA